MSYECVVKRLVSNEIAVTAWKVKESPLVQTDMALLEVERSVVDMQHLDWVLASGRVGQSRERPGWCSLLGRVAQVGGEVDNIRLGDRVSAIGPVASHVVLPARQCLVVPDNVDADQAAYWALLIALVHCVRQLRIEIGESVLVLGGGLVGNLVAQLSLVAGAALVVGADSGQGANAKEFKVDEPELAPTWVTNQDSLQKALPDGEVDVLIDVWGDFEQLGSMLPMVRTGGRAMLLAVNEVGPVDFDFYPDIHRRSLTLINSTLGAALRQNWQREAGHAREAKFISHLLENDRLSLAHRMVACVRPVGLAEQVLPTSKGTSLAVQWKAAQQ